MDWTVVRRVRVRNSVIRSSSTAHYMAIVLFMVLSQHVAGQQATIPCGLNYEIYKTIQETTFARGSFRQAIDTASSGNQRGQASGKIALGMVAYNFKTHFVPGKDGHWKTISP